MQSAFLQILLAPLLFRKYSHKIITLIYTPNVLIQTSPDFTIAFFILTFSNRQSFLRLHFTPHPATYFAMQRYGTFCSIPYWLSRDFHAFGLKTPDGTAACEQQHLFRLIPVAACVHVDFQGYRQAGGIFHLFFQNRGYLFLLILCSLHQKLIVHLQKQT